MKNNWFDLKRVPTEEELKTVEPKESKDKADLLANGYIFEVNTNNQYAVLAVDKALGG